MNRLIDHINFEVLSFANICWKIRAGVHFSLARYGDGEFNAMLYKEGENCDGHPYTWQLASDLRHTLRTNPEYYLGLHQSKVIQAESLELLRELDMDDRVFVSNAVFHCAQRDGIMQPLWQALEGKKVAIIAPAYIEQQKQVECAQYISIPGNNTASFIDGICKKLMCYDLIGHITLISASMAAPLIVDFLYRRYRNNGSYIDFGSCFDPYVGLHSRSFHRQKK
jgi:hypothetical protein